MTGYVAVSSERGGQGTSGPGKAPDLTGTVAEKGSPLVALLLPGPPHQSTCESEPWSGSRRRHPVLSWCLSGSGLCAVWPAPGLTSNSSGWTAPAVGRQRAAVTGQGLEGASCRSLLQSSMAEYGAAARVDPWLRLCPARPVFPFPRFPPLACLYSCCKPSVLHWTARRVLLKPGEPHPHLLCVTPGFPSYKKSLKIWICCFLQSQSTPSSILPCISHSTAGAVLHASLLDSHAPTLGLSTCYAPRTLQNPAPLTQSLPHVISLTSHLPVLSFRTSISFDLSHPPECQLQEARDTALLNISSPTSNTPPGVQWLLNNCVQGNDRKSGTARIRV